MNRTILAISLGVRNSVAFLQKKGQTLQVYDELDVGSYFFPSLVAYQNGEAIPCNRAMKGRDNGHYKYVVENVRLLIGLTYEEYSQLPAHCSFGCEVVKDSDGYPRFVVSDDGMERDCIEVTSEIFKAIRKSAMRLNDNREVDECCLSIPACFSDDQIRALSAAAKRAGLRLRILVPEPIAAVMSWYTSGVDRKERLLVFDFGSETLDVSMVEHKENGQFGVVASAEEFVGGRDVDMVIANMVIDMVHREDDGSFNPLKNNRQRSRFLAQCEEMKTSLASATMAEIDLSDYGLDECEISRAQLESLLSYKLMDRVNRCLNRVQGDRDCQHVLLVGGSTRLFCVHDSIRQQFHCDIPIVNPDTCVVEGALKVAVKRYNEFADTKLSSSYGILCGDNAVAMVLNKGKTIPCESERLPFRATYNAENCYSLSIYRWNGKDADVGALVQSRDHCEYAMAVSFRNTDKDEIVDIGLKVGKGEMRVEAYRHRTNTLLPLCYSYVFCNYCFVLRVCCVGDCDGVL